MPIRAADYDHYFNWTMSYKLDSDIQLLYGRIEPKTDSLTMGQEEREQLERQNRQARRHGRISRMGKRRPVVWMASHCPTSGRREDYVRELSRYMQVDIYGECGDGTLSCPRNASHWLSETYCYDLIEETYLFYLSFENSICRDYVTEKFFLLLQRRIVPVVYGGADYERLAPPHSFIDARKFTPESLAVYLKQLSANPSLYEAYFSWKDRYTVQAGVEQMARHAFCHLCWKLHADTTAKVYHSLHPQWSSQTQCLDVSA